MIYKRICNVATHNTNITVYKSGLLYGFVPALQICDRVGSVGSPLLRCCCDFLFVCKREVNHFIYSVANDRDCASKNGLYAH